MTVQVIITDNGTTKTAKRRMQGVQQNQDFKGFHGYFNYKGTDIKAYRDNTSETWRADASDTLIKVWTPEKIVVESKPAPRPMKVRRFFSGYVDVTVTARSEAEAIEVAEQHPVDSFQSENTMTFEGGTVEVEDADNDDLTYTPITNEDWIDKHIRPKFN